MTTTDAPRVTVHEILGTAVNCVACDEPLDLTQECWIHFRVNQRKIVGAAGFVSSFIVAGMHVSCAESIAVRR